MKQVYTYLLFMAIFVLTSGLLVSWFFRDALGNMVLVYESDSATCPCHAIHIAEEIGHVCSDCGFNVEPMTVMDEGW